MKCYIITYEPMQANFNLQPLYDAIKAYGFWARITESVWAVVTDQTAVQIRDNLSHFLPESKRLFVIRSGAESAWVNVMCNHEWLKTNLIK